MIDLRQLRALGVLAEELHFGRAAERLGMAQPHFSALIRRVENELGVQLFHRRPGVAPTGAGTILIEGGRRALEEVSRTAERARMVGRGEIGRVQVAFASTVMLTGLPAEFAAFRASAPDVELILQEMHSGDQWEELLQGRIDLALTREVRPDPRVKCHAIVEEGFVVALSERHPLATLSNLCIAQLKDEPLIIFREEAAPMLHRQIVGLFAPDSPKASTIRDVSEWHTALAGVGAGFGVAVGPESLRALQWPGVVCRDLEDLPTRTAIFLCWIPERLGPAAERLRGALSQPEAAIRS